MAISWKINLAEIISPFMFKNDLHLIFPEGRINGAYRAFYDHVLQLTLGRNSLSRVAAL
jgi:hypothetical protein